MSKIEIESLETLQARIHAGLPLTNLIHQGLDLRGVARPMLATDISGSAFLGCLMTDALVHHANRHGCWIIPPVADLSFDPFRGRLYRVEELLAGYDPAEAGSYDRTPDWRTYLSCMDETTKRPRPMGIDEMLLQRIHDASIDDALAELLQLPENRRAVAIMGGHDTLRGSGPYRDIAFLSRALTRDREKRSIILSGGGPGIMEAANLGAYFAAYEETELSAAIAVLEQAPAYRHEKWLPAAWRVRTEFPPKDVELTRSIGVPTWFYGHERPNVFAAYIAKYFQNSLREDGLLTVATGGIVFAEGNGGTVQEIFQDACQNYYAPPTEQYPMILFGAEYWNPPPAGDHGPKGAKPVYPALRRLAEEKGFLDKLLLTSDPNEALRFLQRFL
jgi:predicted Rossmann-fold nucleotide-binding protein